MQALTGDFGMLQPRYKLARDLRRAAWSEAIYGVIPIFGHILPADHLALKHRICLNVVASPRRNPARG
jgi:hypothetical protein